ncbi:DUF167 domain-containing protein [Thermodesulfobacteriota bacterium]
MKKKETESKYTEIDTRIIPKSSRNEIAGREGSVYRIKVTSPPVDGKANKALITLLSKLLKTPKKNIKIISGEKSRLKRIRINDISDDEFLKLMG